MKDSFYFQHDYHSRSDPRILMLRGKFSHEGYSVFWMLLETMAESRSGYVPRDLLSGLTIEYGSAITQLVAIVEYCIKIGLFFENKKGIYSERMVKHKEFRKERSRSGKKGAKTRWGDSLANGSAIAQPMQRKGKERKGKKSKYNNIKQIKEKDLQEISEKYGVKLSFVKLNFEKLKNYCESTGKRYKNYKSALRNFVIGSLERIPNKSLILIQPKQKEKKIKERKYSDKDRNIARKKIIEIKSKYKMK